MKTKFTFFIVLFLLATGIDAAKQIDERKGSFLKNRPEIRGNNKGHNPFQRKINLQKQEFQLKSAEAVKQRLDSLVLSELDETTGLWAPWFKEIYSYDANWNIIEEIDYELDDTTGMLILVWKALFTYNTSGNLTQGLIYDWDENLNQ